MGSSDAHNAESLSRSKTMKNWIQALFIFLHIAALCAIFLYALPPYPTGWDAPYYMNRIRYLIEQNVLSNRVGFIALMAAVHSITGISIITLQSFVPAATTTLLALSSALLASRIFRKSTVLFLLTFSLTFWSQAYLTLNILTTDNVIGLSFALFTLYVLSLGISNWKYAFLFSLTTTMVAISHFESYVLLISCLVFYFLFLLILEKWSLKKIITDNFRVIYAIILTMVIAYLNWADVIVVILKGHTDRTGSADNASIPYAHATTLQEIWTYLTTGLSTEIHIAFFILGMIFIIKTFLKDKSKPAAILLGYIITCYIILLYSILKSSIPINRSVLLLPVPLIIGIGISHLIILCKNKFRMPLWLLIMFIPLLISSSIPSYIERLRQFGYSIQPQTYQSFLHLNDYLKEKNIRNFIIVTNTPTNTLAASAYYGLWNNWALSTLPLPDKTRHMCIYFGTLNNLNKNLPTVRAGNQEYNDTSAYTLECIKTMPSDKKVFIIKDLYSANKEATSDYAVIRQIGENISEVVWLDPRSDRK